MPGYIDGKLAIVVGSISLSGHGISASVMLRRGWYPIGIGHLHGFALTTRLERMNDDGTPKAGPERWSSLYPESANLRWLAGAREPKLPSPGHYRAFLVAFTDLPVGPSPRAEVWSEETLMEAPDAPGTLPASRRPSSRYRLAFFVYEYRARGGDTGSFIAAPTVPSAVHVENAGLLALAHRMNH